MFFYIENFSNMYKLKRSREKYMNDSQSNSESSEPPGGSFLQGKAILVVNTGSISKRFILKKIKELGLKIAMLNSEKNWAAPFVDYWILADTYDHKKCIESLQKFLRRNPDVKIEGATTFWEDDIPLLAAICAKFNFIGNSFEAARNTRSKFYMHEVLRDKGISAIPQCLLQKDEDIEYAIKSIGFPAVIKPKYGADSQYVVYVANPWEARSAYQYVRENCTPKFDPIYKYNKGRFVYQKYIQGKEFSIECYIQNGVPHIVGINEKTGMDLPFFIETGDYCPPKIDKEKQDILIAETKAALTALGVENSLAHVEIKLTKNGPQIIEIGSRMGGVYIYRNVKEVYGFDLIQAACEIAFGIKVAQIPVAPQKYLFAKFFVPKVSGVVTVADGFDKLAGSSNVIEYFISKKLHDYISVPPEGYETFGWVLAGGHSHREAEHKIDKIMQSMNLKVSAPQKSVIDARERGFITIPAPVLS